MQNRVRKSIGGLAAAAISLLGSTAFAQDQCLMGEMKMFAGNFAPRGWAMAEGQLLPIAQHSALFSILGTIYGGDGRTTFALPDMRGRTAIGAGTGPGLLTQPIGQRSGTETINMPSVNIETSPGADPVVVGQIPASNTQPSLAVNYIVCMQGIYPSRN